MIKSLSSKNLRTLELYYITVNTNTSDQRVLNKNHLNKLYCQ